MRHLKKYENFEHNNLERPPYVPEFLYHATYREFLEGIAEKGLGHRSGRRSDIWGEYSGSFDTEAHKDFVFLHEDPDEAIIYAENSEYAEEMDQQGKTPDIVVLQIDTKKLDQEKIWVDPVTDEFTGAYLYTDAIYDSTILEQ